MRRLFRIIGSRKAPVHHQDGSFFACGKIGGLEEHVLEDEQHGQHIHQGLIFFSLALPVTRLIRVQEITPMAMPSEML